MSFGAAADDGQAARTIQSKGARRGRQPGGEAQQARSSFGRQREATRRHAPYGVVQAGGTRSLARYLVGSGLSSVPCPCSGGSRTAAAELHTATGNAVRAETAPSASATCGQWPGVVGPPLPLANARRAASGGRSPVPGGSGSRRRRSRSSCSRGRRDVLRVCLVRRAQPFLDSIRYSTPRRGRRAGALLSPSCYLPALCVSGICPASSVPLTLVSSDSFLPSFS
jgi:hypothetical protein